MIGLLSVVAFLLLLITHTLSFIIWITDGWTYELSDYFPTKDFALLFFIPLIGIVALMIAKIRYKLNEDFSSNYFNKEKDY